MKLDELVIQKAILKRSGIIALVVGVVLTLLNQAEPLFQEGRLPARAVFNFIVPFLVSLTAQVFAGRDNRRAIDALKAQHAAEIADLRDAAKPAPED